jgi:membrane protein DedA with SNARE-associated domain
LTRTRHNPEAKTTLIAGALIRAISFGSAGYLFGKTLEIFLGNFKRSEHWAFALLLLVCLLFWAVSL